MENEPKKDFLPDAARCSPANGGVVIPPVRLHRYKGIVKMHYVLGEAIRPAADAQLALSQAERALARFCGKESARLAPSHAAARAAAVLAFARAGMRVLLSEKADAATREFFAALDARLGTVTETGGADALTPDFGLVYGFGEAEPAQAARRAGVTSIADITWAPFFEDADVLLCDAQIYFGGEPDRPAGAVMASGRHAEAVRAAADMLGCTAQRETAWRLRRGMELFGLRWRRHCAGGAALAELLRGQPQVREVEYSGKGGRLALRLREGADARELMLALSEFGRGRGGGVYSQAFSPALAGESEDPALLCLFAGMEEPEVLTEDVRRALARL